MEQAQKTSSSRPGGPPGVMDWGVGRYESTAAQLLPAADAVVNAAGLSPGVHVLDLGCGTGNAALLAAERGAEVVGVDPASRLLEVARARAAGERKHITFLEGEAACLPVEDSSIDVVLSVFGVIFASDPRGAVAEMVRVLAPLGRIVYSAWLPEGPVFEMNAAAAEAVRQALGAPSGPEPFAWHDRDALQTLLPRDRFRVEVEHHSLVFSGLSPDEYLDVESRNHPLAVAGLQILEQAGQAQMVRRRLLEILKRGNEGPGAFRATSHYVVVAASGA